MEQPGSAPDRVVVGVAVVSQGRLLAARRVQPAHLSGWELPGGKVEPGESHADAAVREVREELGCDVQVVAELDGVVSVSEGYVLRVLVADLLRGEPIPTEHDAIRWLAPDEFDDVAWLAADVPFVNELARRLGPTASASFDERGDAEAVVDQLRGVGARLMRDRFAGEDDDEDVGWVVQAPASERSRLAELVRSHGGWLHQDEPAQASTGAAPMPLPDAPKRLKRPPTP